MHTSSSAVVELRQYTLRPGGRDVLVELFEREFIEPQEAAGMEVGGLFLDRDAPDRFVWFRGFPSMDARRESLQAFYGGPVWAAHGPAANATMLDSDDVLLLRATDPPHRTPVPAGARPPAGSHRAGSESVAVTVYRHRPGADDLAGWLARDVHATLERVLGVPVATCRTEPARNNFPRLPVRADSVFVWSATFPDEWAHADALRRLEAHSTWRQKIAPRLHEQTLDVQHLRLQPTARSRHAG